MPFKDPAKRRQYHKEYRARKRSRQGLPKPGETPVRKAYFIVPGLRLPGVPMIRGSNIFVTADEELQRRIEADPIFGIGVFGWEVQP